MATGGRSSRMKGFTPMNAVRQAVDVIWPPEVPRLPATAPSLRSQTVTRSTPQQTQAPTAAATPTSVRTSADTSPPPALQLDDTEDEVIIQLGASAAREERRRREAEDEGVAQTSDAASIYSLAPMAETDDTKPATTAANDNIQKLLQNFSKISINDTAFTPKPFSGKGRNAGEAEKWLRYFENYTSFRNIEGTAKLQLFLMLMIDTETDWIRSLPIDTTSNLDKLIIEFRNRHALTQVDIWAKTVGLWERTQTDDENCDDYIAGMQVIASSINLPDDQLCHVIIKGLREDTQLFCLQTGANTLAAIKAAARISEAAQAARKARTKAAKSQNVRQNEHVMTMKTRNTATEDINEEKQVRFGNEWKPTNRTTPPSSPRRQRPLDQDDERRRGNEDHRDRRGSPPNRSAPTDNYRQDRRDERRSGERRQWNEPRQGSASGTIHCKFCNYTHPYGRVNCGAKDVLCFRCNIRGHFARCCLNTADSNYLGNSQSRPRPR